MRTSWRNNKFKSYILNPKYRLEKKIVMYNFGKISKSKPHRKKCTKPQHHLKKQIYHNTAQINEIFSCFLPFYILLCKMRLQKKLKILFFQLTSWPHIDYILIQTLLAEAQWLLIIMCIKFTDFICSLSIQSLQLCGGWSFFAFG